MKQLRLKRRTHFANFVQQNCALIALLKLSWLGTLSTGKCPSLVPEQLALQQLGRQGGTVDLQ